MSRRLMNRIRRIAAQQSGDPSASTWLLTRREALKLGSLALAGLALPRTGWTSAFATPPRIAIVGGGIAGMTAALTLQDRGVSSTVFEASGRIGGRMHSNHGFWQQGQTSEWCGEFVDTGHILIRSMARRFGLTLVDVNAASPPGSVDTNYFFESYYTDAEITRDLLPVLAILNQQAKQIGPTIFYNQYNAAGYQFDHLSGYDWIETYVPGGHSSRLGRYLDRALVSSCGLDTQELSSINLILPTASDERFHIHNGNQQLPQAIARSLPAGSVRKGWRLTSIAANNTPSVTLRFDTGSGPQEDTFDFVILALPFSVLRKLDYSQAGFDELKQTAIQQIGYGTNSKLSLQFDDRYWNGRGPWPARGNGFAATDLPAMGAWDSSRAETGSDGLLTNYTGGSIGAAFQPGDPYTTSHSSQKVRDYAQTLLAQFEQLWPGISAHYNGFATLSYPTGDPNRLGSYSAIKVGQYTSFFGYAKVPQNKIHFAGEHTSEAFLGFMEGGAETGRRAAQEVLAALA